MERSKTLPRKEKILSTRENFNRGYDTTRTDDKDKLISVGLMDKPLHLVVISSSNRQRLETFFYFPIGLLTACILFEPQMKNDDRYLFIYN